jgi:thiamine-phosphate pyrophosphorylase
MNILVVDDQQNICHLLEMVIKDMGHTVITAHDGIEAIEKVSQVKPELMFMDIRMPRLGGIEALEKVKEISKKTNVVMMSAYFSEEIISEVKQKGAYFCLAKPFDMEVIKTIIQELQEKEKGKDYLFYRLLDANFNRGREGLRVVEETARFILNNFELTNRLKNLRHELSRLQEELPGGYKAQLKSRQAYTDVGADFPSESKDTKRNYLHLVIANFKRIQEALRVIEEYIKLSGPAVKIKKMRFAAYCLEQEEVNYLEEFLVKLKNGQEIAAEESRGRTNTVNLLPVKRKIDYSLCVIVDRRFANRKSPLEIAQAAISGGASIIQLREKEFTTRQLIEVGKEILRLAVEAGVTFIINDRADVALAVGADGVHLGQEDLKIDVARQILGPEKIIGVSTRSLEQARKAQLQGADYIGVGPLFENHSKDNESTPVGLNLLKQIAEEVQIPKIAIGGIKVHHIQEVINAGADGIAVIKAAINASDITASTAALRVELEKAYLDSLSSKNIKNNITIQRLVANR